MGGERRVRLLVHMARISYGFTAFIVDHGRAFIVSIAFCMARAPGQRASDIVHGGYRHDLEWHEKGGWYSVAFAVS